MIKKICYVFLMFFCLLAVFACSTDSINKNTQAAVNHNHGNNDLPILEVTGVFSESDGDSISLISLDHKTRYRTIISIPNLGDKYIRLKAGDRVQIAGEYAESYPVQILNISQIKKVANPDKDQCEATKGNIWKPQGKAQIPSCVITYSDAGKPCGSSSECQGDCMIRKNNAAAACASSNSRFGCGSSIEDYKKHGGILCVD